MKLKNRKHISDTKLRLDISLLQPPQVNEHAIVVTPNTSTEEIVHAIQLRLKNYYS